MKEIRDNYSGIIDGKYVTGMISRQNKKEFTIMSLPVHTYTNEILFHSGIKQYRSIYFDICDIIIINNINL